MKKIFFNFAYALLDRRDMQVDISFGEKIFPELGEDEEFLYGDYNVPAEIILESLPSQWGSATHVRLTLSLTAHRTAPPAGASLQFFPPVAVRGAYIQVWAKEESFISRGVKESSPLDDGSGNYAEAMVEMTDAENKEVVDLLQEIEDLYLKRALLKLVFQNV